MSYIDITTKTHETYSSISNFFIDYYMTSANGEFVKVYLYLVRLMSSRKPVSFADIADHFNLTEKDICRAIRYWIKQKVLHLEYNDEKELTGITLLPLEDRDDSPRDEAIDTLSMLSRDYAEAGTDSAAQSEASRQAEPEESVAATTDAPVKKPVSYELLQKKQNDETLSMLIFETSAYLGKTLSMTEIESIIYIHDQLGFSSDLIEYLIEYCINMDKTSFRYIEAVAVAWYKKGIDTVDKARLDSTSYDPVYRKIFHELGIRRQAPTGIETAYIEAWTHEWGFSEELILLACGKAVLSRPQSANFAYVNGILDNWHKNGVKSPLDVEKLDKEFMKKKSTAKPKGAVSNNPNGFAGYTQKSNSVRLDELEMLLADQLNQKEDK